MSTITATQRFALAVLEAFTAVELPASNNRSLNNDQFNKTVTLSATTTPPGTKGWAAKLTSSQTINLAALTRSVGPTIDATGLRLQMVLVNNLSTTATLAIDKGASNGYPINGAAGGQVIPPGGSWQAYFADGLADVAAGARTLDATVTPAGSGTEVEDFEIIMVFG